MNKSCIYKITNLVNNKIYIGSTNNYYKRKNNHFYNLNHNIHPNPHLQNSWNKYTKYNFKSEIIELCEIDKLIEREQYYIDSLNPNYNISKIAGRTTGIKCKEETKLKIGLSNLGKRRTEEYKKYRSEMSKGKISNFRNVYLLDSNRNLIKYWKSCSDASREYNLNRGAFSKLAKLNKLIISNKSKLKGFIITYIDPNINNQQE